MQTIILKIKILNVIELEGLSVKSIVSFVIADEKKNQGIIEQAEKLFKKKAIANGAPARGFDAEIGYNYYENGTYFVQLVWSE